MDQRPQIDHELLLAQAGWVRGLAATLVRDPVGAEDLAQETLLAALARPPHAADDERSLRAWLARVVTNLSHLAARGNARRRGREELAARSERVPSAHETVERAAQLKRVVDAALALDEPYRSTVLLRFFEGLDSAEIGRRTGAAPAAVRKRLSRGLERLRAHLDDETDGDRSAWRLALLPLLGRGPGQLPAPGLETAAETASAAGWCGAQAAAGWLAVLTLSGLTVCVGAALSGPEAPEATRAAASPRGPAVAQVTPGAGTLGRRVAATRPGADRRTQLRERAEHSGPAPSAEERQRAPVPAGSPAPEAALPERAARAVDLLGTALGGVALLEVGGGSQPLGFTGLDGRLVLEPSGAAPDPTGPRPVPRWVSARAPGLATVREGRLPAGASRAEALVVAARAIEAAGLVLDPAGLPLAGARLELEVPDAAYVELFERLEGTRPAVHATTTDALGRFRFDALPTHPELVLCVTAEGLGSLRVPVPAWSRPDWVLRFEAAPPRRLVEGLVRFPDGAPVAGALVRAGEARARTDLEGRYRLELGSERAPDHVLAELDGWQPGAGGLPGDEGGRGGSGAGGPGSSPFLMAAAPIELPGPLLSIPGTALGPDGGPAGGWEVLAIDEGLDPRHPTRPPGAVAASSVSGPDGAFVLRGLLDRPYRVVALDPESGAQAGPLRLPAGARATLRPHTDPSGSLDGGRVATPGGAGLGGALVFRARPGEHGPEPVGPAASTGADGFFEALPAAGALGGMWLAQTGEEGGATLAFGATVELAREAWFLYSGGGGEPRPDALGVLDGEGRALELHPPSGPTERVRLARGRGPVVRTVETAATLVLYREGAEQARLPLVLHPGELTVVHHPGGGGSSSGAASRKALEAPAGVHGTAPGDAAPGPAGSGQENPGSTSRPAPRGNPGR